MVPNFPNTVALSDSSSSCGDPQPLVHDAEGLEDSRKVEGTGFWYQWRMITLVVAAAMPALATCQEHKGKQMENQAFPFLVSGQLAEGAAHMQRGFPAIKNMLLCVL